MTGVVFLPLFAAARVRKTYNDAGSPETFFIRVTMETIIVSFALLVQ